MAAEDGAPDKPASPHAGHRSRLRERFLKAGAEALADHELIELLLFGALPRIDTIEKFALSLGVSPAWLAYGEGPADDVPTNTHADTIGQRLESARKERGLSRQALGHLSGLTGQTVANIEVKGMVPRVDTAEMLARVLGVTAAWLAYKFEIDPVFVPEKSGSA